MTTKTSTAKGILKTDFRPIVGPLKKGEKCNLARHFRGPLGRLIKYFEGKIEIHGRADRLVYPKVETMRKWVGKEFYKSSGDLKHSNFGKRNIEYALKQLRDLYVISGRFTNESG